MPAFKLFPHCGTSVYKFRDNDLDISYLHNLLIDQSNINYQIEMTNLLK